MTHTILIIDDEIDSLTLLKFILTRFGYSHVLVANNPQTGLQTFYRERPDLLLLDDYLPSMDGTVLCQSIKSDPNVAHIPVVIMTSRVGTDYIEECLKCGADDVLIRPYLHIDLAEYIGYFVLPDSYG